MEFGQHRGIEFGREDEVREVQSNLLKEHVAYCRDRSPHYGPLLRLSDADFSGLCPDRMGSLPCTSKADIEKDPSSFLAAPKDEIVDIVLTSGTTGIPTAIQYTERDLDRLAYNEELSFMGCGMTSKDVVLLTCTMDRCFIAGLAYFLGVRRLGASAIRNGQAPLESHREILRRMNPTVIVGVPSFLRRLGLHLKQEGETQSGSSVKKLVCIGEPIRDETLQLRKLGSDIETLWSAQAFSTYASSETVTTFCECTSQQGGHLHPDLALVEILDEQGQPVPDGAVGEVVVTPLGVEGMPLIRFMTGDMSFIMRGPCRCGRTSPRLGPIIGRKRQMMKVRGTSLYPQMVFAALDEIEGVTEYYLKVTSDDRLSDDLTVHVAFQHGAGSLQRVEDKLQARLRVKPHVIIESEDEIRGRVYASATRKPVRFIDERTR